MAAVDDTPCHDDQTYNGWHSQSSAVVGVVDETLPEPGARSTRRPATAGAEERS
jgi:hypothetical protein